MPALSKARARRRPKKKPKLCTFRIAELDAKIVGTAEAIEKIRREFRIALVARQCCQDVIDLAGVLPISQASGPSSESNTVANNVTKSKGSEGNG